MLAIDRRCRGRPTHRAKRITDRNRKRGKVTASPRMFFMRRAGGTGAMRRSCRPARIRLGRHLGPRRTVGRDWRARAGARGVAVRAASWGRSRCALVTLPQPRFDTRRASLRAQRLAGPRSRRSSVAHTERAGPRTWAPRGSASSSTRPHRKDRRPSCRRVLFLELEPAAKAGSSIVVRLHALRWREWLLRRGDRRRRFPATPKLPRSIAPAASAALLAARTSSPSA